MVDWMVGWIDDDNAGKTSLFVSLSSPPRHLTRYISELFSGRCFDADFQGNWANVQLQRSRATIQKQITAPSVWQHTAPHFQRGDAALLFSSLLFFCFNYSCIFFSFLFREMPH